MPTQNSATTVLSMDTLHQTVKAQENVMFVLQNIMNGEQIALLRDIATTAKAVTLPIQGNVLAASLSEK